MLVRFLLCQVLSGRLRFSFCGGLCGQTVHLRALHWSAGSRGATILFFICLNSFCNIDILTFLADNAVKEDHIHDDHDFCHVQLWAANIVVITKIIFKLINPIRLWRWPWSSGCAAVHWKRTKWSRCRRYWTRLQQAASQSNGLFYSFCLKTSEPYTNFLQKWELHYMNVY